VRCPAIGALRGSFSPSLSPGDFCKGSAHFDSFHSYQLFSGYSPTDAPFREFLRFSRVDHWNTSADQGLLPEHTERDFFRLFRCFLAVINAIS
jgi:hypothetical protein